MPELTAEENVALPLLLGGTRRQEALARRPDLVRTTRNSTGLERHRAGEMSGGQAQRVALARGLVAHPEVLFADEPTGSLDSLTGELVMDLMTSVAREEGTTVVLVTHEPRVAAYADREVIVRDGVVTSTEAMLAMIRLGLRLTLGTEAKRPRSASSSPRQRSPSASDCCWLPWPVVNGLHAQTDRGAWLDTAAQASPTRPSTSDRLWWLSSIDQFGNQAIDRVDVAAAGPNAPVPPGIPHLPGPGEYYASPALTTLSDVRAGRTSFVTGFRGARSGPSAPRRCRPRTR